MKFLGPTQYPRLNEGAGLVFLALGIALTCALISYHPLDPSWNTATVAVRPVNLIGRAGSHVADLLLQIGGLGSFTLPALLVALAWKWFRSDPIEAQFFKVFGAVTLVLAVCTAFSLGPQWRPFGGTIAVGGTLGHLLADCLLLEFNTVGAILITASAIILSLYVVSKFSLTMVWNWLQPLFEWAGRMRDNWRARAIERRRRRHELAALKAAAVEEKRARRSRAKAPDPAVEPESGRYAEVAPDLLPSTAARAAGTRELVTAHSAPPWDTDTDSEAEEEELHRQEIPIHALEDYQPAPVGSLPP